MHHFAVFGVTSPTHRDLSSPDPGNFREPILMLILMRNFDASKALSNFDSVQGAGAQAQQRGVKLPAAQR